jgi:hypothetical protein
MKLMQSICCLFSSRCASEVTEAKKADRDAQGPPETRDASTAPQKSFRPATRDTNDSGSGSATS